MTEYMRGLVRRLLIPNYGEGYEAKLAVTPRGEMPIAFGLPERTELVRLGNSYSAQIPAASAFNLLITIPTTRAELCLQNNAPLDSGICLIIERFWVKAVTSMGSLCALTPLSQLVIPGTTLVADDATILRTSMSGKSSYSSFGTLCKASTATGALTDKWNHHESAQVPATTNIAACKEVLCYGRYIIPPGGNISLNAQESVSGGTGIMGIEWHDAVLARG